MEQLKLFEEERSEVQVVIPKEIVSPLESKRRLMSKPFIEEREKFTSYVKAIQEQYKCTWFEARKMFFEHRDNQKPITLSRGDTK